MQRGGSGPVHSSDIQVVFPSIFQENKPGFSSFLFAYQEIRSQGNKKGCCMPIRAHAAALLFSIHRRLLWDKVRSRLLIRSECPGQDDRCGSHPFQSAERR